MKLSFEKFEEYSAETGFRTEALEKVIRLGEFLADVGRHRLLSRVLVLKGGAALNICTEAPKRLSVDLDFNYVGSVDRSQMLKEKPDIERAVQIIGKGQGYLVQMSGPSHAGRKIYLSYIGKTGTRERIEVDLNFLFRVPLGEIRQVQMWQPGNLTRPVVGTVSFAELAAGKLCALLDRVTPRDLFDAVRLPDHSPVAWNTLFCRRLFIALGGSLAPGCCGSARELCRYAVRESTHERIEGDEGAANSEGVLSRSPGQAKRRPGLWCNHNPNPNGVV